MFLIKKFMDWFKTKLYNYPFFKRKFYLEYEKSEECECLTGSCMLFRRAVFTLLGGFDESVPMYLDDIDICHRNRKIGYKNFFYADAKIIHIGQHSTKKAKNFKIYDNLCMQAHLFYYRKHYGMKKILAYKIIICFSIPYLLALDIISLPLFLCMNQTSERFWVIKKHCKYFNILFFNKVKVIE